jgi:intraflagellar transport protein 140
MDGSNSSDAALAAITADLSATSSVTPATLLELATRFQERGQWESAARALVGAGRLAEAAAMVELHEVPLDDVFADKLAPPERGSGVDDAERSLALRHVAKAARKQGLYQLAARKYTQVR